MNIKEVKKELPMVRIKINGKIVSGRVTGRLNKFASVSEFGKVGPVYHFSWEAITRAVNNKTVLKT